MPMKIECADCAGWTGLFNKCKTCKGSKKITVHTTAELKQAKIEAYQNVLDACNKTESLDCIKDFIEEKIYFVEKKMEE